MSPKNRCSGHLAKQYNELKQFFTDKNFFILKKNKYSVKKNLYCVFKPKGYNIVNAPRGERDRSSPNGFSCFGELTPLPSPSSRASRLVSFKGFIY